MRALGAIERAARARGFRPASRNSIACWAAVWFPAAWSCWAAIPGIGKSTLLLQAMAAIGASRKALYVTGEESVEQVALRAQRLGLVNAPVSLLAEVQLETIVAAIDAEAPEVVVIDSIQTVYTEALTSAPGSVAQVRECAAQLTRLAKQRGIVVIFVGHVTKDGAIAGPRVLEHIVDTVLYFEGDTAFELPAGARDQEPLRRGQRARRVRDDRARTQRRRQSVGAVPVAARRVGAGLGDRRHARRLAAAAGRDPGAGRSGAGRRCRGGCRSASIRSGWRCCSPCCIATAAWKPAATTSSSTRSGGVRITEPAADLAILLAVHSSLRSRPLPAKTLVFGEVGLAGEIRPVQRGQERIREAAKLGFRQFLIPNMNKPKQAIDGVKIIGIGRVDEAVAFLRD